MADKNGMVAYRCMYCGEDLHEPPDDHHAQYARPIYNDSEGNQYCSEFCRNCVEYDMEE